MDEYLQTLEIFYDEKMKYLTKKDKYIKCNECSDDKTFTEKDNKLILSCGKEDGECGPQIIIELPEYIHYESKLNELRVSLNNQYNWEALEKYLNVTKEHDESKEKQKKINEEIIRIEKLFFEKNMEMKQKELQKFYDQRIKQTKKCKEIQKKLLNDELNDIQKKELRQEYVKTVQEINKEYQDIKELIEDINPFLENKLPKVTIKHENYIYEKKKVKKSSDRDFEEILIDKILQSFVDNDNILTKENYLELRGTHKTPWGTGLFRVLDIDKSGKKGKPWKHREQKKHGPIIVYPRNPEPKSISLTNKWVKLLALGFTVGDKVSWVFKGNTKYGTIIEVKGKGALVRDEKGNEKIRLLKSLIIEEFSEDIDDSIDDINEEENVIKYFSKSKDNKWLSTFNKANPFDYEGLIYPTVEHAFHAQKVNDEKKEEYQKLFTDTDIEPNEAKKMGGKKYFTENNYTLRNDWNEQRLSLMENITKIYYNNNPEMFEKLKETGDRELIHTGFRIDDYWGVKNDQGENNHGKILMKIRNDI
tara:strand:- start:1289 stop:2887 length:1599 start_codon:yes stop_codon:yes gene_type:complete